MVHRQSRFSELQQQVDQYVRQHPFSTCKEIVQHLHGSIRPSLTHNQSLAAFGISLHLLETHAETAFIDRYYSVDIDVMDGMTESCPSVSQEPNNIIEG